MKTKQNLETLIVSWMKWTGMAGIKRKDFIDVVPVIPFQNSSWIMGSKIYGERRIQICIKSRIARVYTNTKIADNTNNNHIMIAFTDHYNIITLFLLTDSTQKLKLEKIHGTLIILFYVSPGSPQLQRICFFLLKY